MSNFANHSPTSGPYNFYSTSVRQQSQNPWQLEDHSQDAGFVTLAAVLLGGGLLVLGLLISVATGLLYLAELIEEHTRTTKKVLSVAIKATIGVHLLLLLIDRMPLFCVSSGVIAQLCYTQLLRGFPFVALSEPRFLASSIMLVVNHCVWMQHFLHSAHSVEWVICFFFIVVWMVPFGFMMSLASTDSMLPGAGSLVKAHQETKGKGTKSSMLQLFSFARAKRDVILPKALEAFQTDPRKGHGE